MRADNGGIGGPRFAATDIPEPEPEHHDGSVFRLYAAVNPAGSLYQNGPVCFFKTHIAPIPQQLRWRGSCGQVVRIMQALEKPVIGVFVTALTARARNTGTYARSCL